MTEQGRLTRDNDLSKTAETKQVIDSMVDGLNAHKINGIAEFFDPSFHWYGNAGCGTKNGLREFQENWQRPFQAAFSDKVAVATVSLASSISDGFRLVDDTGSAISHSTFITQVDDTLLRFDYQFANVGGGDQLGLWVDDQLRFILTGLTAGTDFQSASVDISDLSPGNHYLSIGLEKYGNQAADVSVGNFTIVSTPEPAAFGAIAIGFCAIMGRRRKPFARSQSPR